MRRYVVKIKEDMSAREVQWQSKLNHMRNYPAVHKWEKRWISKGSMMVRVRRKSRAVWCSCARALPCGAFLPRMPLRGSERGRFSSGYARRKSASSGARP